MCIDVLFFFIDFPHRIFPLALVLALEETTGPEKCFFLVMFISSKFATWITWRATQKMAYWPDASFHQKSSALAQGMAVKV